MTSTAPGPFSVKGRPDIGPAQFDVCVVGGAGHVGAPLAIVLAASGKRTMVFDTNSAAIARLANGEMPFIEYGAQPLLRESLQHERLAFSADPVATAGIPVLIVTIGTPIDEFHNPRLDVVARCLDTLMPFLTNGQTVILRSTVFPGTTEYVDRYLREHGRDLFVAFCPERVVQGQGINELQTLPQIVSGLTAAAEDKAAELFSGIAPKIIRMGVREAEFSKLISNAYRYIQFAAANQFYMMATAAGIDYSQVLRGLKEDYPRLRELPGPGFAAGPCLMKDTMQLAAFENNQFSLGQQAVMVNEGLPNFIVERLIQRYDLTGKCVGILGMAFKADIDDTRDSLSYKLAKVLRFHGAKVVCSDHYVRDSSLVSAEELIARSDIVVVGVPHSAYRRLHVPDRVDLVDLWGVIERPMSDLT